VHGASHLGTQESLRTLIEERQYSDLPAFVAKNKLIVLSHNDEVAHAAKALLSDVHTVIELDCKEDGKDCGSVH
jgi:hypothetical protein